MGGEAVEAVGIGVDQPCGAAQLTFLDHVHGLDAGDDSVRAAEWNSLKPIIGRVRRLIAR